MTEITEIQEYLRSARDLGYQAFQAKLIPTVDPARILGVRTPRLRLYAKIIKNTPLAADFLNQLPHAYFEENQLHAFLLEQLANYDWVIAELERFLPFVDNWATCDSMFPKVLKKHRAELLTPIRRWLHSSHPYTVRYAIGLLMRLYFEDSFQTDYLDEVAAIQSEEYYVNMMIAWYFATAIAKQYHATLPYLEHQTLSTWTHNKTIQKATESCRITPEQKAYLRTLRIK